MIAKLNLLVLCLSISFLTFGQGVYTKWHIPRTTANTFNQVEYLDGTNEIMLVSKHHFNRLSSNNDIISKLVFKGEYSASLLLRNGFAVIACDSGSIYTTTNAGESWNLFDLPESEYSIAFCRASTGNIYAAMNNGKIYTSTDNGFTFTFLANLPRVGTPSIAITNNGILLAGFKGDSRGLFRSSNGGLNWQSVDDTLYIHDIHSFPGSDTILASQSQQNSSSVIRLMMSTNSGMSWTKSTAGGYPSGTHYYISPAFVIFHSSMVIEYTTNSGNSWTRVLNGNIPEAANWISASFIDTTRGIAVGKRGTIMTASVSIKNWTKINGAKTHAGGVLGFIKTPETPSKFKIITYETTDVTPDEGASWYQSSVIANQKFFRQCDGVYIGLNNVVYSNPFGRSAAKVSTDGGITFATVYGDTSEMLLGFARFNSERAILHRSPYYPTSFLDRYTTDGGIYWPFQTGISYNDNIFKTGDWRAITSNALTSISFLSDYGKTKFSIYPQFPSSAGVNSLAAPSDSVAFLVSNKGYIVKLDTKKRLLINSTNPLPLDFNYVDFRNNYGLVAADRGFLLYTTDTGNTWKILRTVAENNLIQVSFDDDSTAYAVDEFGGIIKIGFSYTTGIEQKDETLTPFSLALEQNYPNPFNNSTIIKYFVPVHGNVKLSVYDINGELVAVPLNSSVQPGNYELNFDAGNLSSGIYFYILESGTNRITKKFIFLK